MCFLPRVGPPWPLLLVLGLAPGARQDAATRDVPPKVEQEAQGKAPRSGHPIARSAQRQGEPAPQVLDDRRPWWERDALFGDGLGLRPRWQARGIELDLYHLHELWSGWGGAREGVRQARLFDASLWFDGETLLGWGGATFFVDAYATGGAGPAVLTGSLQDNSNIESVPVAIVAEAWWEQRLADDRLRLKLGKVDANGEFAYAENALLFVHPSMGVSPTIFPMPTFPDPAFSANAELRLARSALRLGVYDGAGAEGVPTGSRGPSTLFGEPDDLFLIGELEHAWGARDSDTRPGRVGLGYWEHTGRFERFGGGTQRHAHGLYLVLDQGLPNPFGSGTLDGFLMLGSAQEEVSAITGHVGLGAVWSGFRDGKQDALGAGLSWVGLSERAGLDDDGELAGELFWRFAATDWLILQPDLQVVLDPGGDATLDDALLIGLRAELVLL